MRNSPKNIAALLGASYFAFATSGHAARVISHTNIFPYDPATYFSGGVTAGLDFDDNSPTQSGFLGVPASNLKIYNLTHNGISFDITVSNANQANQNRDRGPTNGSGQNGDLTRDFEQWYGIDALGGAVEAHIKITGLLANSIYDLDFFTMNIASGNTRHFFYNGTSSSGDLIVDFTTAGAPNTEANRAIWTPGVTIRYETDGSGEIDVTIQATIAPISGTDLRLASRLTFDGMSVKYLEPAASNDLQLTITPNATAGLYDFSWDSQEGKLYDLLTSTDLATPISTWPIYDDGSMLYENLPATGTTTTLTGVPSAAARRFFALREEDAPPIPPLLSENFDDDNGSFTITKVAGTDWAWGDPDSTGPGGAVATGNGGTPENPGQCWGTNIGNPGFYADPTTDTRLQSPRIDLTSVAAAELSFAQATDFPAGDTAVVRLINDDTDIEIVSGVFPLTVTDADVSNANWQTVGPISLPVGAPVRIEWCFTGSGDTTDDYMGWYIDDVQVIEVSP
jgi:hypothetical protein